MIQTGTVLFFIDLPAFHPSFDITALDGISLPT